MTGAGTGEETMCRAEQVSMWCWAFGGDFPGPGPERYYAHWQLEHTPYKSSQLLNTNPQTVSWLQSDAGKSALVRFMQEGRILFLDICRTMDKERRGLGLSYAGYVKLCAYRDEIDQRRASATADAGE